MGRAEASCGGHIHETPLPEGMHREVVMVPSDQAVKRIQRMRTDHGTEVGLRLPINSPDLRDDESARIARGERHLHRSQCRPFLLEGEIAFLIGRAKSSLYQDRPCKASKSRAWRFTM